VFDNGRLIAAAETQFDALVTTDKSLLYQQNLRGRRLAIPVLPTTSWPKLRVRTERIVAAIESLQPGDLLEMEF
jgi:hypothetical protein